MAGIPLLDQLPVQFPDPRRLTEPDGLLAAGGDLTPDWLVTAYSHGIFHGSTMTQNRFIGGAQASVAYLSQEICVSHGALPNAYATTRSKFSLTNTLPKSFKGVHKARVPAKAVLGYPAYAVGLPELFHHGVAHCVEVWQDDCLVGGLYGIAVGRMFCGESCLVEQPTLQKWPFSLYKES